MKFIAIFKTVLCGLFILSATTFTLGANHIGTNTHASQLIVPNYGGGTMTEVLGRSAIKVTNRSKIPMGTLNANHSNSMIVLVQKGGVSMCQELTTDRVMVINCMGFGAGEYTVTVTTQAGTDVHEIILE